MQRLWNRMRSEAIRSRAIRSESRKGLVTAYNPADYTVRVELQPTGEETGWIPVGALAVGNGVGLFWGPNIGDQVAVDYEEGDPNRPYVTHRFFNDVDKALPADSAGKGVPAGECWIVGPNGSRITLSGAADAITIKHHSGSTLTMDNKGNVATSSKTATISASESLTVTTPKMVVGGSGTLAVKRSDDSPSPVLFA